MPFAKPLSDLTIADAAMLFRAVEMSAYATIVLAADGSRVLLANRGWRSLADRREPANPIAMVFPAAAEAMADAARLGEAVFRRAVPAAPRSGEAASWWDLDFVPVADAAGVVSAIMVSARDVTEHVLTLREAEEAREALAATEMRLRLAQEAGGIGSWERDLVSDRMSWSAQQFRLHGIDPARAAPPSFERWLQLVHPDDRARVRDAHDAGWSGVGARVRVEYRVRRADDGAERWLASLGRVVEAAPNGAPTRIVGVEIDVTDQRLAELALRESESQLRLAFNVAQVFSWDWDVPSGRVTWSEGAEALAGLEPGSAPATVDDFRTLVHPDDLPHVEAALQAALAGETPDYRVGFRMRRADGSLRWTKTRGMVFRDEVGRPVRVVGVDYDISEQKLAEAELQVNKAHLRAMVDALPVSAWLIGPDGDAVVLNRTFLDYVGAAPVGTTEERMALIHPDDVAQAGKPQFRALVDAAPCESEARLRRHDGAWRWHRIRMAPATRESAAAPAYFVGSAIDIHAERAAQENEQRQSDRLHLALRAAKAGIFTVDLATGEGRWSAELYDLHGIDPALGPPTLAEWLATCVHPEDRDRMAAFHGGIATSDGASGIVGACRVIHPHRGVRWLESHVYVEQRFADGAPWQLVGMTLDATDRQVAEAERGAALTELQAIYDTVPIGLCVLDPDLRWRRVNAAMAELNGLPADAHIGRNLRELLPAIADEIEPMLRRMLQDGQPVLGREITAPTRRGPGVWLADYQPLRDAAGRVNAISIMAQDVTEMRAAEAALRRLNKELDARVAERTRALSEAARELTAEMQRSEQAQATLLHAQKIEALGLLTSGVAHDFNNILAAILGGLELLRRRVKELRLLSLIDHGLNAANRGARLIAQLMAFVRQEEARPTVLDLIEVMRGVENMICYAVGSATQCVFEIAGDVWPVIADTLRLETVLLNLATNARDAMPRGGIMTIALRNAGPADLPADLPAERDYVLLSLSDTGVGMDAETMRRATEPFFTTKPVGRGTGLGLASARDFARQCGGTLRLHSVVGQGTTVELFLPRSAFLPDQPETHDEDDASGSSAGADVARATILLVEDDEGLRPVTAAVLRDLGHKVIVAPNAEAARALAQPEESIDMLVTDVMLPGMPGPELAALLRAERPAVQVLYVSGVASAAGLSGHQVLRKPFSRADLRRAVRTGLQRGVESLASSPRDRLLERIRNPLLREACLRWRRRPVPGGEGALPGLDSFGVEDLPEDVRDVSYLAEALDEGRLGFRYLRVGAALEAQMGAPLAGRVVPPAEEAALAAALGGPQAAAYRRCAEGRGPVYDYARFALGDDRPVLFERLLLPLSADAGITVTHLLGVALLTALPTRAG